MQTVLFVLCRKFEAMKRLVLLAVVVLALLGVYYIFFAKNPGVGLKEVLINVPKGAGIASVADSLDAHGLLRSTWMFRIAARTMGASKKLHAGLYRIQPGLSNAQIVKRFTGTEYALILQATFPEGITIYRAASIAKEKLGLDSGIFMRYATDTAFVHSFGAPKEAKTAEGYAFPDTYEFVLSADPKELLTRMLRRWKKIGYDSLYAKSPHGNLSLHQIMTLASIVEAEAHRPDERDTIASVYLNRLRIGMKLDADPTVQYGLHLTRPITHDDLLVANPYNTYMNIGLPPGPICNPGAASIRAVLFPAKHDFIYFVARRDGSGGHYFSRTLAEQEKKINIARANSMNQ